MDVPEFRRLLVDRLVATRPVVAAERMAEVAVALGVQEDVLREAIVRAAEKPAIGVEHFDLFIPMQVFLPLEVFARRSGFSRPAKLLKSLLHAAMQLPREPRPRADKFWGPLPGSESARLRLASAAGPVKKTPTGKPKREAHLTVALTKGLVAAIGRRAEAFGASRTRYVNLWLADLVDGALSDVVVVPVGKKQMFASEMSYALPLESP